MHSHRSKVTRVAKHPSKPIFATISNDRTVRLWNSDTKKQISLTRLAEGLICSLHTRWVGSCFGSESGELIVITYTVLSEAGSKEHSNDSAHSPRRPSLEPLTVCNRKAMAGCVSTTRGSSDTHQTQS